jgi:hypothetical protein
LFLLGVLALGISAGSAFIFYLPASLLACLVLTLLETRVRVALGIVSVTALWLAMPADAAYYYPSDPAIPFWLYVMASTAAFISVAVLLLLAWLRRFPWLGPSVSE